MTQRQTAPLQLRDLFADPATGRLSHTRLWSNVGSAAISKALSLKYQAQAPQGGYGPAPGAGQGPGGML